MLPKIMRNVPPEHIRYPVFFKVRIPVLGLYAFIVTFAFATPCVDIFKASTEKFLTVSFSYPSMLLKSKVKPLDFFISTSKYFAILPPADFGAAPIYITPGLMAHRTGISAVGLSTTSVVTVPAPLVVYPPSMIASASSSTSSVETTPVGR